MRLCVYSSKPKYHVGLSPQDSQLHRVDWTGMGQTVFDGTDSFFSVTGSFTHSRRTLRQTNIHPLHSVTSRTSNQTSKSHQSTIKNTESGLKLKSRNVSKIEVPSCVCMRLHNLYLLRHVDLQPHIFSGLGVEKCVITFLSLPR